LGSCKDKGYKIPARKNDNGKTIGKTGRFCMKTPCKRDTAQSPAQKAPECMKIKFADEKPPDFRGLFVYF